MEITDPLHAYIPFQLAVNSSQAQNDISKLRIYLIRTNKTAKNIIEYPTALSFKTTSIILVILRKTIIFAHSDAGSTASGVSFYRS